MKISIVLAALTVAATGLVLAGPANAAPQGAALSYALETSAEAEGAIEQVRHRRHWRHRHFHHRHHFRPRHCYWDRVCWRDDWGRKHCDWQRICRRSWY